MRHSQCFQYTKQIRMLAGIHFLFQSAKLFKMFRKQTQTFLTSLKSLFKYFVQQVFLTHTRNAIFPGKGMITSTGSQMLPGTIKAIVELAPKNRKLSKKSKQLLASKFCQNVHIQNTHTHTQKKNFSVNLIFPAWKCNFKRLMLLFIMQLLVFQPKSIILHFTVLLKKWYISNVPFQNYSLWCSSG